MTCSLCRKPMPTATDLKNRCVLPDVCLCEHQWLRDARFDPPRVIDRGRRTLLDPDDILEAYQSGGPEAVRAKLHEVIGEPAD